MKKLIVITPEEDLLRKWSSALNLSQSSGELSPSTITTYKYGMSKFISWLQSHEHSKVSPKIIKEWKADLLEQGLRPNTVNVWFSGVRKFYGWAVSEGLLKENPVVGIKGVKRRGTKHQHLRDPLSDHEVLLVLEQPNVDSPQGKRDLAILCLFAYCALRTVEIHRADFQDLTNNEGLPLLRVQVKGSSEKDEIAVIANPKAQQALYDYLAIRGNQPGPLFLSFSRRNKGNRLSTVAIRHLVKDYFRSAGINDSRKTTHSLRHSAITKVALQDIRKARQVARHASFDTTMIYLHESDRLSNPGEQFIDYQID